MTKQELQIIPRLGVQGRDVSVFTLLTSEVHSPIGFSQSWSCFFNSAKSSPNGCEKGY